MLDQLQEQNDVISQEAAGGSASSAQALSRLPKYLNDAKAFFVKNLAEPVRALFSRPALAAFARRIQPVSYVDLRDVEVVVPPGLKTDFARYAQVLLKSAEFASTFRVEVLDPFTRWLAGKVSDPSSLNSLRPSLEIEGYKKRPYEARMKELIGCFDEKSDDGLVTYGKALKRNADWTEVMVTSDKIQAIFLKDDDALIQQQVAKVSDLLDLLMKRIAEEPETYQLSSAVITSISNTAFAVAREIEFYGLVRYRTGEFAHALNATIKRLNDALAQQGK
jgi:hypothetical protein